MDQSYDTRTPSRPTNDRNRLDRSESDFESIADGVSSENGSGIAPGGAATISARAPTGVMPAVRLAATGRRTPRHGPNFLFAPSPLSLRVRSEGEGHGYRWRRPRRQGCVAGSRAFRAPLRRDRLAVGGQGRGEAKPMAIEPSSWAQNARSGHDRTRP